MASLNRNVGYKYPITFLVYTFSLLPSFVLYFIWSLSMPFEGRLSVLLRFVILSNLAFACQGLVYVGRNVTIKNADKITFGNNVSIHACSYLDGYGGIEIGSNVSIAHNSTIISAEHTWSDATVPIKYNNVITKPVVIKDDVWLGCGVRILAGSTIESRVVVAAGCVVNSKLLSSNSIYAGVPVRKVKDI